jgi:hypothetical protein
MSCSKEWDFEFVAENTDPGFHNRDYRVHRAKLLQERERSLLPATQAIVVTEKRREKVMSQVYELQAENDMLAQLIRDNKNKIQRLRNSVSGDTMQPTAEEKKKPRYVAHCPVEECNGFIGEKWQCGICEAYACRKCHRPKAARKDPEHKCNKDDVETAKLLASDTKPCPNCKIPIFKISGCDQMWCTSCHTPFSWKTGKVETGVVHNPHFYQFQRNANGGVAPRARGDVRCGGAPDIWAVRDHFRKVDFIMPDWLETARRMIDHVRAVELRNHPDEQGEATHQDLRVRFLMKRIDEKKWLSTLKQREKKREKNRAIHMVLVMFADTLGNLFGNLCEMQTAPDILATLQSMYELRTYANTHLQKIADRFKNKTPMFREDWQCISVGVRRNRY